MFYVKDSENHITRIFAGGFFSVAMNPKLELGNRDLSQNDHLFAVRRALLRLDQKNGISIAYYVQYSIFGVLFEK
jgi:hypothetical protein